ncbi:aromatic ring-hydroxylating dioxygenase subunit alpha [Streptomyces sp. NPDC101227]|uniref:aromatic ring-hydroxylating oxygenase subunit alpha n=1 Tax=Streptomyces sp. NPDC101227 TaxID=3366136 RepID=UPI0037FB27E5
MCVTRSSELPKPGSFRRVQVGGESVLLVRNRDGELRAHINLCRHRGVVLCTEDSGQFNTSIRCPYHGWTFDLNGQLTAAPFMKELPPQTKERHLYSVSVSEWLGYIWVNLDPSAVPLADQLAPMLHKRFGDVDVPGRYGCDELEVAKRETYEVNANWKILFENFCECYHCPTMHPEVCDILPEWRSGYGTVSGPTGPKIEGSKINEKAEGFSLSGRATSAPLPGVPEHDHRTFHGLLLWPNVHLMFIPDHVMCMRFEPLGPAKTRVIVDWLFHPTAVSESGFDPSDAVALVDVTARQDFEACERVQAGAESSYFEEFHTPHESMITDFRRWLGEQLSDGAETSAGATSPQADVIAV